MGKMIAAFFGGIVFTAVLDWNMVGGPMFDERIRPLGAQAAALMQRHIQGGSPGSWSPASLRSPLWTNLSGTNGILPASMIQAYRARSFETVRPRAGMAWPNPVEATLRSPLRSQTEFPNSRIGIYHRPYETSMFASCVAPRLLTSS